MAIAKRIYCKVHNNSREQIISHVGVKGSDIMSVGDVIILIGRGKRFYTRNNGKRVEVYKKRGRNGRMFLTTNPDDTWQNNLDFLPPCK